MNEKPLLLIIDDEPLILKTLKESLEDEGLRVETTGDSNKALAIIGSIIPDLILLDICMPHYNGIDLLAQIKLEFPRQKVIMMSGFGTIQIALNAIFLGALDFIEKPLNLDEVLLKIQKFVYEQNNNGENKLSPREQFGLIGKSHYVVELMRQIELTIAHNIPILLTGEYGIGKTLTAAYIHHQSAYVNSPFFLLDCSPQTTEVEIKNLFSGPQKTIYARHIENLTPQAQNIFACLIEKTRNTTRIIASTTQSLWRLLKSGSFDALLFHELNMSPIEIPALRKRAGDIPLLVDHYLLQANKKYKKNISLTTQSIRMLRNQPWHENITELKATCTRIVLHAQTDDQVIHPHDITAREEKNILYLTKKNYYNVASVAALLKINHDDLSDTINNLNIQVRI